MRDKNNTLLIMIKEIKTEKFEGLAVLVPDDASGCTILDCKIMFDIKYGLNTVLVEIPCGSYRLFGLSHQLTEEQCAEIMPETMVKSDGQKGFMIDVMDNEIYQTENEAFTAFLQFLGCYSVNPYGEKPAETFNHPDWEFTRAKWKEAQANTGTWIILKKL